MPKDWAQLLMTDHEMTEQVFDAFDRSLAAPNGPAAALLMSALSYFQEYVDGCHNRKEEDHLFRLAEARGIPRSGGPLAVMLGEHDDGRRLLPQLANAAERFIAGDRAALGDLREVFGRYQSLMKQHFWKENDVLYPMARRVLTKADAEAVLSGIAAAEAALGPGTRQKYYAIADQIIKTAGVVDLSRSLDPAVLAAILNTLPVELSFVDADERVQYFSHENQHKIFPRTRGAIGMAVQGCHPPKSLHLVNRILADFKAGRRTVAEFWIEMQGRMVHIRYFAVWSPERTFLGTLEVVQDVTGIRALTGQRRILDES